MGLVSSVGMVAYFMGAAGHHILHVFPGFDPGGTQVRTVQLMGLMPAGVRHSILAMDGRHGCAARIPEHVSAELLEAPPKLSFRKMGRYFAQLIETHRPDAVMTYNWGSIEMVLGARRARFRPLVHHEDGFGPEESERYLLRRILMRRWLLRSATAVAVPSLVLRDLATSRWKVRESVVHYLPNGVDLVRFRPRAAARADATGPVVLGSVGHLRPEKNHRFLLEAFARTSCRESARLDFYGDGPERPALERLAQELGVAGAVRFCGAVSDAAVAYAAIDIFALPSRTEQMPLTVLEAMACGLPVIATDVGDVRAMVDPVNHALVIPKDAVEPFAAALDQVVADAVLREQVGAANRQRAEAEFESTARYQAWLDLYASSGAL